MASPGGRAEVPPVTFGVNLPNATDDGSMHGLDKFIQSRPTDKTFS